MTYLVGVLSEFIGLKYYQTQEELSADDFVVVSTQFVSYVTKVYKLRRPTEKEENNEDFNAFFPPILRKANKEDLDLYNDNLKKEKEIVNFTQKESDKLNLGMKIIKAYFDIKDEKILITFTADGRVDFRELVKILTPKYRARIELRQIGARDYAKVIGGIGPCGLPLCCSVFIKEFANISINMAKNQLLAPSIPKLSGQCNKLFCCLKYEDEDYSALLPTFPEMGFEFKYHNKTFRVISLNVLTGVITCSSDDSVESFTKEEFERVKEGKEKLVTKSLIHDINSGVDLLGKTLGDIELNETRLNNEERNTSKYSNQNNNVDNNNNNRFNKNNKFNPHNNKHSKHFNNKHHFNKNKYNNRKDNNSSGYIKVSSIEDKSVLDYSPNKKDNEN